MQPGTNSPIQRLQHYRDAWIAIESISIDSMAAKQDALEELDSRGNLLWEAIHPLIQRLAKLVMRGGAPGRDIVNDEELAQAVSAKLFSLHPILIGFDIDTSLEAYLTTIIKNVYRDDLIRVHGRNEHMPRIYVDIDDPVVSTDIKSERRTQSGYFALKQTNHHLNTYLSQLPGSLVAVTVGGKTPRIKMVRLTKGHADLLRQWMAGEGDLSWDELASSMGRPMGTIKRWFSEVTRHFLTDPSPDAIALRSLFNVKHQTLLPDDDLGDESND